MRKLIVVALGLAFIATFSISTASADVLVTGAYAQQNNANQVMSVGKTQMQIGATDRVHANYINARSGAGRSHSNTGNGGGSDFQWGSSQTKNVWKTWRTVEDAGNLTSLVVGDCRGDNSTDAYFKRMNISRKGYDKEKLVTQAQCEGNHTTN